MTESTAHLFGGPHDGETVTRAHLGKELLLPDDGPGGVYVLHSRVTPITDRDFIYRWVERS